MEATQINYPEWAPIHIEEESDQEDWFAESNPIEFEGGSVNLMWMQFDGPTGVLRFNNELYGKLSHVIPLSEIIALHDALTALRPLAEKVALENK